MNIIAVRWVGYEGKGEYYARRMDLPLVPFPGLGLPIHEQRDMEMVQTVYVNQKGDVVARLGGEDWDRGHCMPMDWPSQHAWLTRGWSPVGKDPCWETSL